MAIVQNARTKNVIDYYSELAKKYHLDYQQLDVSAIKSELLDKKDSDSYLKLQAIPIDQTKSSLIIATANPTKDNLEKINAFWGEKTSQKISVVTSSLHDITEVMANVFSKECLHDITYKLYDKTPDMSARNLFSKTQAVLFCLFLVILIAGLIFKTFFTLLLINVVLTFGTVLAWGYKFFLSIVNLLKPEVNPKHKFRMNHDDMPMYTVLIALYRENELIVHHLLKALLAIDYPPEKLDIKLLLEEDDLETSNVIKNVELPAYFQVIHVPAGQLRTKPRACNYGLEFAVGDYVTIYDAEDLPDPKQLKKVIECFKEGDEKLVCVQGPLNFYNAKENLLTRFFTIEYTAWFDQFINALASLKLLLPLGGTSNHFKVADLRKMNGWDPFNCTEDAEMGVRLCRHGYHATMVNSTTYEEANTEVINWIKQRTRWNKGYLQTFFVHMRHPLTFIKQVGFANFINFQLFIFGSVFSQLANIPLWIFFIAVMFVYPAEVTSPLYPGIIWHIAWINFLIGNILFIATHLIGIWKRHFFYLLPFGPLMVFYWLLMSIPGYYAIYDLIVRPSFWYKTEHGMSKYISKKAKNKGSGS